ncbi:NAD(P)-binding domain-containing protein [Flavobacterium tistrianum]|uniref:hypothetical protein n=1 Tax=Flavobacterium tistrianum TaxID=1685414 RepID=UPI000DAF28FA|nr:hypothetical protein [Flavobacterium tistrianum]KAF2340401.1 hypothetical protein DMB71_14830 [Flavobacterium tistrianum]
MEIGIIGISSLTIDLAGRASKAGFRVIINNPKGGSLIRDCIGKMGAEVRLGSLDQAAAPSLIVLFLPKENLEDTIQKFPDMSGKTVLYASGLISDAQSLHTGITKAMEYQNTASLLPAAHMVKLFNAAPFISDRINGQEEKKEELFFMGDCSDSRNKAAAFLKKLQFLPVDLSCRLQLQNSWISRVSHWTE